MTKPLRHRQLSEELAIVLTPLAVLFATSVAWLIRRQTNTCHDAFFVLCLVGVSVMSVLLGMGFRYYKAHPFVGLLTALTLLFLFVSQDATANNVWQFVFGLASLGGGGALTITFLVLSLKTMKHGGESAAPTEALGGPDTPDARWQLASGGRGEPHQVMGID